MRHLHRQPAGLCRKSSSGPSRLSSWWWPAVLSGNRNFEARIHPAVRANYLASPPLVVAYALRGTVDIDLSSEPLGIRTDGRPVYLSDLCPRRPRWRRWWPRLSGRDVPPGVREGFGGRGGLAAIGRASRGPLRVGRDLHVRARGALLCRCRGRAGLPRRHPRGQGCWPYWVTRSPPTTSPRRERSRVRLRRGRYLGSSTRGPCRLQHLRNAARQSRGARAGAFANVRLAQPHGRRPGGAAGPSTIPRAR